MDNCLIANFKYDKRIGLLPMKIGDEPVLALRALRLLDRREVDKLMEYVDLALAKLDNNRRRKFAKVRNKKAAKRLCSRVKIKELIYDNKIYQFHDYCEQIEIVRWLGEKFVSDKSYSNMVEDIYQKSDDMIMTCVIGLDPPESSSMLSFINRDEVAQIRISEYNSLLYCENSLCLKEVMSKYDHTQIYFHMIYKPKITQIE